MVVDAFQIERMLILRPEDALFLARRKVVRTLRVPCRCTAATVGIKLFALFSIFRSRLPCPSSSWCCHSSDGCTIVLNWATGETEVRWFVSTLTGVGCCE